MTGGVMVQSTGTGNFEIRHEDAMAWVVIDRPAKRNALSPQMWAALPDLLQELDADPSVRVIGLKGAGDTFSAGADIVEVLECLAEVDTGLPRGGLLTVAAQTLAAVRKPTVCVLQGYCMGGAWMLAQACDLRIAVPSLRIGLTPARIGIIYPEYGIETLVRLVGPATASYLLLTGDTVTAEDAERWGMLTRVVPEAELERTVNRICAGLGQNSQLSVQAHKYLIAAVQQRSRMPDDPTIRDLYAEVVNGPDAGIGRQAFLAKSSPDFDWAGERFWAQHR